MLYCETFQRNVRVVAKQHVNDKKYINNNDLANEIRSTLNSDVERSLQGKQWLLSCFAPFAEKSNLPSFVDDISFEELHLKYLQSKKNGTVSQYTQEVTTCMREAKQKYQMLQNPNSEVLHFLVDFHSDNIRFNSKNPFYERSKSSFGTSGYNHEASSSLNSWMKPQAGLLTNNNSFEDNSRNICIESKAFGSSKSPFSSPVSSFVTPSDNVFAQAANSIFSRGSFSSQSDDAFLFKPATTSNLFGTPYFEDPQGGCRTPATFANSQQNNAFTNFRNSDTNAFGANQNPFKWVRPKDQNIFQTKQVFADNPIYENSNLFGEDNIDMSAYSKLDDLTEEEVLIYETDDDFETGKIPINPPTYEMCHRRNLS